MANDLSLDMSADPDEFDEAVAEFAKRRVITRAEADKLENYAKRRSWWISGIAQMDVVNDAHQSILDAMESGIPFEEWKKTAGAAIEKEWGREDSARLLTIFRNATTQALNAGRWEQMHEPHVMAMRPYVEYDVVDDLRTTEHICRPLIGVVLPLDDLFVLQHNPPLHHRCRTGLRSKRKSYVEKNSVTKDLPNVTVTPGFGYPPNLAEIPKPSQRVKPPDVDIQLEMAKKAYEDAQKRKPVKVELKPEHTPEHWEPIYRERYGESAAKPMAYGRAVAERAKGLSVKDALKIADSLGASQAASWMRPALAIGPEEHVEAAKVLAQHIELAGGYEHGIELPAGHKLRKPAARVGEFYKRFASPRLESPPNISWRLRQGRGQFEWYRNLPGKLGTVAYNGKEDHVGIHEFAHAIELASPKTQAAIQAFLQKRTAGEASKHLAVLTGIGKYGYETAKEDHFIHPYIGKDCVFPSSEVLSVGVQTIANGEFVELMRKDPEMAYLILGVLAGWF
jgi:hypothetical protein